MSLTTTRAGAAPSLGWKQEPFELGSLPIPSDSEN